MQDFTDTCICVPFQIELIQLNMIGSTVFFLFLRDIELSLVSIQIKICKQGHIPLDLTANRNPVPCVPSNSRALPFLPR